MAGFVTVGLGCLIALSTKAPVQAPPSTLSVAAPAQVAQAIASSAAVPAQRPAAPEAGYYDQLRSRLRWVQTRMGSDTLLTPDLGSRMLLAKSAAHRARLADVGLGFKDVYGIINAETSWVPRTGASRNGTPNIGIAQFEPATAKALGMRNANDPVEAVHVAAVHMKEAALWSADRLEGLNLGRAARAEKLREGVSIYYNLSTRGRNAWNGTNTDQLPRETQRHIENARLGALEAAMVEARLQTAGEAHAGRLAFVTASAAPSGS